MKGGTALSVVALLGGVWVILAPIILGYVPKHGNPWGGLILGSDIIGVLVIVAALAGLAGFWGNFLKTLPRGADEDALADQ